MSFDDHGETVSRYMEYWASRPSSVMKLTKRSLQIITFVTIFIGIVCVTATLISPRVAWRFVLLKEKLSGKIPEIPLAQLLQWSLPGSHVNLSRLAEVPDVNASITNIVQSDISSETYRDSAAAGARAFRRTCAGCHGDDARGGTGPNLIALIDNMTDWKFFSTVKWGRPKTVMTAQPLSDLEIWQVCAFLRQSEVAVVGKRDAEAESSSFQPVSPGMLRSGGQTGDWLTYAGNYAGYRHGSQNQIARQNVQSLRLAWAAQVPSDGTFEESSPIVVGSRMFVTEPPEGVTALNAETGAVLWQFHRPVPPGVPAPVWGMPNKGVAILGKYIYVATFDAHLLALDAVTGVKVWDVAVADWHEGYSMTGAPLAVDDRIVVGVAGGDLGVRGFLAAYSASDGAQQWKFYTVPGPGQPGSETWAGDSWKHGGAATWTTGSYDPNLGLIYWGTGNPAPAFNSRGRRGINLYSASVIALDARTGELRWYYQFTPSDDHDWDSTQQPVLADIKRNGQTTPVLFFANRNAFFYAIDRKTGQFLFAKPFARQTWASGFAEDGRPIVLPSSHPSPTGNIVSPASSGATNWWPPSFDPKRNLLFVPSADTTDTYFNIDNESYREGKQFLASGNERAHNQPTTLAVRAVDVLTGQLRWDSKLEAGGAEVPREMGGVLSTDGGLVFAGFENEFHAFDADTGASLWKTPLGGVIHGAPISYMVGNRQYIAVFAGRTLFVFALPFGDQSTGTHVSRPLRRLAI
jgi:alcohol dehydrogenase (cytochrome c)